MSVLSGEKVSGIVTRLLDSFIDFLNQVDIHVMKEPPSGEWSVPGTRTEKYCSLCQGKTPNLTKKGLSSIELNSKGL